MKLTIKDRLLINELYPKESNLISQILVKDINEKVNITQNDIDKYNIKPEKNGLTWNVKKDKGIEVGFTDKEIEFLKKQVERLDAESKITQSNIDLCLKIKEYKELQESKK